MTKRQPKVRQVPFHTINFRKTFVVNGVEYCRINPRQAMDAKGKLHSFPDARLVRPV